MRYTTTTTSTTTTTTTTTTNNNNNNNSCTILLLKDNQLYNQMQAINKSVQFQRSSYDPYDIWHLNSINLNNTLWQE